MLIAEPFVRLAPCVQVFDFRYVVAQGVFTLFDLVQLIHRAPLRTFWRVLQNERPSQCIPRFFLLILQRSIPRACLALQLNSEGSNLVAIRDISEGCTYLFESLNICDWITLSMEFRYQLGNGYGSIPRSMMISSCRECSWRWCPPSYCLY